MKTIKAIILALLVLLIIMQFYHRPKNQSKDQSAADIAKLYYVPANVGSILNKACNDCHSNNTRYPWYSHIQPVEWWLNHHIKEGMAELNFSNFGSYRIGKQYHKLEEIIDQVKKGEMPLSSYTLLHTDAKLTDNEKVALTKWADSIRSSIAATYPADSLKRKR